MYQSNRYYHTTIYLSCVNNKQNGKEIKDLKPSTSVEPVKTDTSSNGKAVVKKSRWRRFKDEVIHIYHGFKLFFLDVKVAFGILNTVKNGKSLTRRERKQLVRTAADMLRMVPFVFFIIVPFMELLLPMYFYYLPFMLPSTFKTDSKDKDYASKKLKAKLEIAKFLQEAIHETAIIRKDDKHGGVDLSNFSDFLKQVRESGMTVDTKDILRFSHLFEDEVTLESLDAKYLKALCKLLDINTLGPPTLLRFQLKLKVRQLKVDDQMIANEGIDKIPIWELQQLCRERGMRSYGVSEERLRYQLSQWLSLNLEKKVPITLLLLSRVMYLPETLTPEEQLKQAILVLPKTVSNTAKLKIVDTEGSVDNKTKFEAMKEEHEDIKKERIEAEKATKEAKVAPEVVAGKMSEILQDAAPTVKVEPESTDKAPKIEIPVEEIKAEVKVPPQPVPYSKPVPDAPKTEISAKELADIESAISQLEDTKTVFHKEEINILKENREEISKKLSSEVSPPPVEKVVKRLGSKVDKMIDEIEKAVENIEVKASQVPPSDDKTEIKPSEKLISEKVERSEPGVPKVKTERFIHTKELLEILKKQQAPDDKKWQTILTLLDEDGDGKIEMDHLIKMIKLLNTDDIKLSSMETSKLLELIDKEAKIAETKKPPAVPEDKL